MSEEVPRLKAAAAYLLDVRRPADALAMAPEDAELHCLAAAAHLALDRPAEALAAASSAARLDPGGNGRAHP